MKQYTAVIQRILGGTVMGRCPHPIRPLIASLAILAAVSGCGDVAREGRSPVYLVINSLQAAQGNKPTTLGSGLTSDVITNIITPAPCSAATPCPTVFNDVGSVVLGLAPKDVSIAPTTNNQVTINRYHVDYKRRTAGGLADVLYGLTVRSSPPCRPPASSRSDSIAERRWRIAPGAVDREPPDHQHDRGDYVLRQGPGRERHQRHRLHFH